MIIRICRCRSGVLSFERILPAGCGLDGVVGHARVVKSTSESLCRWVGVHLTLSALSFSACAFPRYLSLATGHGDVDETAGVGYSLLRAALGGLLLLLRLDL